ncbi:hypothetical protein VNI00_012926 [Paramarasmius palmivorus]|uniref:Uncharacterized protein n=1 Tax=Paramarasmius palmivorus TaxID=297713 RepID=A0AAW0BYQ2_9AGAR
MFNNSSHFVINGGSYENVSGGRANAHLSCQTYTGPDGRLYALSQRTTTFSPGRPPLPQNSYRHHSSRHHSSRHQSHPVPSSLSPGSGQDTQSQGRATRRNTTEQPQPPNAAHHSFLQTSYSGLRPPTTEPIPPHSPPEPPRESRWVDATQIPLFHGCRNGRVDLNNAMVNNVVGDQINFSTTNISYSYNSYGRRQAHTEREYWRYAKNEDEETELEEADSDTPNDGHAQED